MHLAAAQSSNSDHISAQFVDEAWPFPQGETGRGVGSP